VCLPLSRANIAAVVVFVFMPFAAAGTAFAHRVNVFAWVEGDTVHVEGTFAGGKKVNKGKILVKDPQGVELLSGLTDDQGAFSFKVPQRTDLKIVLVAGQGHRGQWTLRAAELGAGPSGTAPITGAAKAMPGEAHTVGTDRPVGTATSMVEGKPQPGELERLVESVLDRKLKPIVGMLADIRNQGPTVGDVFAGIGYIFGLVGVAAYVKSRKPKP
jgi:nickel transport protein